MDERGQKEEKEREKRSTNEEEEIRNRHCHCHDGIERRRRKKATKRERQRKGNEPALSRKHLEERKQSVGKVVKVRIGCGILAEHGRE
jgi:hypothetical protein